jgi:hypothetical protein
VDGAIVDPASWSQQMESVTAMVDTVREAHAAGKRERAVAACDHAYHDLFRAQFVPSARGIVPPTDLIAAEYAFGRLRWTAARRKSDDVEAAATTVTVALRSLATTMEAAAQNNAELGK